MAELSRRDFLRWSAAATGVAGLPLGLLHSQSIRPTAQRCLVINLVGGPTSHGQPIRFLGEPLVSPSPFHDPRYGQHAFGRLLAQAQQALEHDVPFVTVNLATTLCDQVSWDCHADGFCLNSTLEDYR